MVIHDDNEDDERRLKYSDNDDNVIAMMRNHDDDNDNDNNGDCDYDYDYDDDDDEDDDDDDDDDDHDDDNADQTCRRSAPLLLCSGRMYSVRHYCRRRHIHHCRCRHPFHHVDIIVSVIISFCLVFLHHLNLHHHASIGCATITTLIAISIIRTYT